MLPRTSASALEAKAISAELPAARSQRGSPKNAWYQRSDRPGGGNSRDDALENDIGTTTAIGRQRNSRTAPANSASSQRPKAPSSAISGRAQHQAELWAPTRR